MPSFIDDITKKAEKKEAERKAKEKRKQEEIERRKRLKEVKRKESIERDRMKIILGKIVKAYAKMKGDYIKVEDVEIIKDPKGGIYGKVGDEYFYSSGEYSELKPEYTWSNIGPNYIHVGKRFEPTIEREIGDPYTNCIEIPYEVSTICLKSNTRFSLSGTKSMSKHVAYVDRKESEKDPEKTLEEHREKILDDSESMVFGQIEKALEKKRREKDTKR